MTQTAPDTEAATTVPSTLICVSGAEESVVAMRFGCQCAKSRNHQITILHVVEPTEFQGLSSITEAIRHEREEKADRLLSEMENLAEELGIDHPAMMIREDTLSGGILSAIEENPNINMIILAIHPDSHRAPKLMAALTEQLGKTIHIPIMMVPGGLTDAEIDLLF